MARETIIIIIIEKSGGRISSWRELASFLKENLPKYSIRLEVLGEYYGTVSNAALFSAARELLKRTFGISGEQAEEALWALHEMDFIRISDKEWPLIRAEDLSVEKDRYITFNV